jgi:hypothetical protein
MRTWKITYKFKLNSKSKWQDAYRVLQANSREDAIKKADMWPPLIKAVQEICKNIDFG